MSSAYPEPGPTMLIDAVDAQDRPIGTITRREVLHSRTGFRVAHLFIFNARGELLIQQLAPSRDRHPLRWGSSVAAYLFAGEAYDQAIRRRAAQELGLTVENVEPVGRTVMRDTESTKFISLFHAHSDGPFTIDQRHITLVQFVALPEIARQMRSGERAFTPTFQLLFDFYLQHTSSQ